MGSIYANIRFNGELHYGIKDKKPNIISRETMNGERNNSGTQQTDQYVVIDTVDSKKLM